MTEEELKEIRERATNATKGPWTFDSNCRIYALSRPLPSMQTIATFDNLGASDDCKFTSHSRTDIPRLLDEIERLKEENSFLREATYLRRDK